MAILSTSFAELPVSRRRRLMQARQYPSRMSLSMLCLRVGGCAVVRLLGWRWAVPIE
jgi:hypothetical protein